MITYGKRIAKRATFDVGAKKSILGYIAATKRIPLGEAEVIYNGLIKEDNQKFALCLYRFFGQKAPGFSRGMNGP